MNKTPHRNRKTALARRPTIAMGKTGTIGGFTLEEK